MLEFLAGFLPRKVQWGCLTVIIVGSLSVLLWLRLT